MFARLGSHFEREATWKQAVDEHRGVVAAIARHDADLARAAMSGHLDRSHERFSASWPASSAAAVSETNNQRTLVADALLLDRGHSTPVQLIQG